MHKQGCVLIIILASLLTGCFSAVWTGATLVYDRHTVYGRLTDYELAVKAGHLLARDKRCSPPCFLELAVFQGDILLLGHVPSEEFRQSMVEQLKSLSGYRALYNQITVSEAKVDTLTDSWITAKIRSSIFSNSSIAPKDFKVVTFDKIVYLMGEARENQAEEVIEIARRTNQVVRVVKLLHVLSEKKSSKVKTANDENS